MASRIDTDYDFKLEPSLKLEPSVASTVEEDFSGEKLTKCLECQKLFKTKKSLKKHIRSRHEGIKYPCSQCD